MKEKEGKKKSESVGKTQLHITKEHTVYNCRSVYIFPDVRALNSEVSIIPYRVSFPSFRLQNEPGTSF